MKSFDSINVGDTLPPLELPPLTRTTLALYAGASGDHNPMHIDIDFARGAGMPDVFAHGMLSMAWLGRLLTNWAPQRDLREVEGLNAFFIVPAHVKQSVMELFSTHPSMEKRIAYLDKLAREMETYR